MDLKEKIDNLPIKPGIYLMKDKYDNVIYVGKSVNLRSRVKSYFRENINRSKKKVYKRCGLPSYRYRA